MFVVLSCSPVVGAIVADKAPWGLKQAQCVRDQPKCDWEPSCWDDLVVDESLSSLLCGVEIGSWIEALPLEKTMINYNEHDCVQLKNPNGLLY